MRKLYIYVVLILLIKTSVLVSQELQITISQNIPSLVGFDHTFGAGGSLITMPDGRIFHFFRLDPGINGNHVGNAGGIAQRISIDNGQTWGPTSIIYKDEFDDRFATSYRLDNGTIVVFFFRYFCYDVWNGVPIDSDMIYSTDDGITWSNRIQIYNKIQTVCFQNIFKIPGNPGYYASAYSSSVVELRYSPDGLNWDSITKVWDYRGNPMMIINEPYFCALPDGRILGYIRVENMPIHQVTSLDYGNTWSPLMPTNLAEGYFCPEPIVYYDELYNKIVTVFTDRRGYTYDMQNNFSGVWIYFSDPNQAFNNPLGYSNYSFITRAIPNDFRLLGYASATKIEENKYLVVYSDTYKKFNGLEDAEYFQLYITIEKHPQFMNFEPLHHFTYENHPYTPQIQTQSGLPINLISSDTSIVKIQGDSLLFVGTGFCDITAVQSGNYWFDSVQRIQRIEVRKAPQSILMPNTDNFVYGTRNLSIPEFTNKNLPLEYEISDTSVITFNQGHFEIVGSGMCVITARNDGNNLYNPVYKSQTIIIQKANQHVSISVPNVLQYNQESILLPQYTDVNLPIIYYSSDTSILQIRNDSLVIVGTGLCEFMYMQLGDKFYNSLYFSEQIFVEKVNQSIDVVDNIDIRYLEKYLIQKYSTSVELPIHYISSDTSIVKVTDSSFVALSPGFCTISAVNNGSRLYNPIVKNIYCNVSRAIVQNEMPVIEDIHYAQMHVDLPQFSSQNLQIEYESSDTNIVRIHNGQIQIVGVGVCVLRSYQHGNNLYEPIEGFQTLNIEKSRQFLDLDSSKDVMYADRKLSLPMYSNVDLPITYVSSDTTIAKIENGEVVIVGVGECNITAIQNGSTFFDSLIYNQQLTVYKSEQNLVFQPIEVNTISKYIVPDVVINSGLPIDLYSSDTTVAKITNGLIEIVGPGTCFIYAEQLGNDFYFAANVVSQLLKVENVSISKTQDIDIIVYPNPVSEILYISNITNATVSLINMLGVSLMETEVNGDFEMSINSYSDGQYLLKIEKEGQVEIVPILIKK